MICGSPVLSEDVEFVSYKDSYIGALRRADFE